jgi:ribosomal protein S18 acetylase RimI-like enzyme
VDSTHHAGASPTDADPADGVTIRQAVAQDAMILTALGTRLFTEAYGGTHPEPELGHYLARNFAVEEIREALGLPGVVFLLVQDVAGEAIGYVRMQAANLPAGADISSTRGWEIQRFYLDSRWHGRGLAQRLMATCLAEARARSADLIWLQAWREAARPLAFYQRAGFRIVGTTTFAFGDRVDLDWLMAREP